jgi:hypothetical protein
VAQAYVLLDVGRQDDALALAVAAKNAMRGGAPDVLAAWLHAVEGEMAAACGDELAAGLEGPLRPHVLR